MADCPGLRAAPCADCRRTAACDDSPRHSRVQHRWLRSGMRRSRASGNLGAEILRCTTAGGRGIIDKNTKPCGGDALCTFLALLACDVKHTRGLLCASHRTSAPLPQPVWPSRGSGISPLLLVALSRFAHDLLLNIARREMYAMFFCNGDGLGTLSASISRTTDMPADVDMLSPMMMV